MSLNSSAIFEPGESKEEIYQEKFSLAVSQL